MNNNGKENMMQPAVLLTSLLSITVALNTHASFRSEYGETRYELLPVTTTNTVLAFRIDSFTGEVLILGSDNQFSLARLEAPTATFGDDIGGEHWVYTDDHAEVREVLAHLAQVRVPEIDLRQEALASVVTQLVGSLEGTPCEEVEIGCSPQAADFPVTFHARHVKLSETLRILASVSGCPLILTSSGVQFAYPEYIGPPDEQYRPPLKRFALHLLPGTRGEQRAILFDSGTGAAWSYSWDTGEFSLIRRVDGQPAGRLPIRGRERKPAKALRDMDYEPSDPFAKCLQQGSQSDRAE
jgi:hypothetical protein